MDHLTAVTTLCRYLRDSFDLGNAVVVASDVGRAKMADKYAMILELPIVVVHKRRSGVAGLEVEVVDIVGDVHGKTPVLIDDVVASGSIYQQADALVDAGAEPAIISVSHGVLVGPAVERLDRPVGAGRGHHQHGAGAGGEAPRRQGAGAHHRAVARRRHRPYPQPPVGKRSVPRRTARVPRLSALDGPASRRPAKSAKWRAGAFSAKVKAP